MTTHELAKKLLEGPDVPAVIEAPEPNEDTFDVIGSLESREAVQIDYGVGHGFDSTLFDQDPRNHTLETRRVAIVVLR